MEKEYTYDLHLEWTGNEGSGTDSYISYKRDFIVRSQGKPDLKGSADPAFRGDVTRYNPEELFLAALSSCHMLWYLHFCSDAGIVVIKYSDAATGSMITQPGGSGRFKSVLLKPLIIIKDAGQMELALQLHTKAHACCFIANSVNFEVACAPEIIVD